MYNNWPGRSYHLAQSTTPESTMPLLIEDNPELTAPLSDWTEADRNLLKTADAVVSLRDDQYGECWDHHMLTANLWSAYLGCPISPEQVSVLFILDKIVRSKTQDKPDHWVDVAGYAAVHAKVQAAAERFRP